ncbi:hypothetical protein HPB49_008047 [Dermacentor silvarum]|uniref:Uncharacterized protein n=1 Tax=Dermacentor silvarum TaxID=543639 RepID=A0ACB8DX18_DERSI|nr:hypothetical protein HPB49_008047 [Dermacentor silvarum]
MKAFGLAKPYFRRHLKADAVPTVFDQTKLSQPPAPRCKAVKRRASDYTNDSSYVCDELNYDDSDPDYGSAVTSKTQYFQYQRCYLLPAVEQAWQSQQKSVIEEARHQPHSLAGDGRCDTPGHSADFGTYTLLDTELNKIMHTELVKSTEVSSSNKMEKGLERALDHLIELGLHIDSLVTDRHCEIKAFIGTQHPMICHLFDLWHIAKGRSMCLFEVAQIRMGA